MISRRMFLSSAAAPAFLQNRRPNVIVILTDDQGYHDLGCQGAADLKTPHIDALAASGIRFTDWYSNAPMCAPSRAALMTGRYPIRAGVPQNGPALPDHEVTLARLLKDAGYSTAILGKWHLGSTNNTAPTSRGFDSFYGFHSGCIDYYSHRFYWGDPKIVNYHDLWRNREEVFEDGEYFTSLMTREAREFLGSRREPFFLYLAYNAPHYPMHAPKRYVERFANIDPERCMYAAMLAAVDDSIGEIVETLRRNGQLENTLIFFAADNGATREARAGLDQQSAHGGSNAPLRGFKFSLFDGGIRVPAILSWPAAVPAGRVTVEVGAHFDILPTVSKAAGVALPTGRTIDGRDMLPVVTMDAESPHETLFWASGGQQAARRGRWKLVLNGMTADGPRAAETRLVGDDAVFLSDIVDDPAESQNLRQRDPAVVEELTAAIKQWSEQVRQA